MDNHTNAKSPRNTWTGPASQGPVDAARKAFSEYARDHDIDRAWLLAHIQMAMQSDDAEFLVELGEQLAMGIVITRDLAMAETCFRRALSFNKVMGSYALGRYYFESNSALAREFLLGASREGHIVSRVLLNTLAIPSNRAMKKWAYLIRTISFFPFLFRGHSALLLKESRARLLFWRYHDDMKSIPAVDSKLGSDRNIYFPWTRPIHVKLFCAACKKSGSDLKC